MPSRYWDGVPRMGHHTGLLRTRGTQAGEIMVSYNLGQAANVYLTVRYLLQVISSFFVVKMSAELSLASLLDCLRSIRCDDEVLLYLVSCMVPPYTRIGRVI